MSDNNINEKMAPDASPGTVSQNSGVRRANNRPLYILFCVLGAFLLVMMMVAADRAAKQNAPVSGPAEKAGSTSMFAKEITGDHTSGMIQPATQKTVPELPPSAQKMEQQAVPIAKPTDLDAPPKPPEHTGNLDAAQQDDEAQRIRMAKLQMLEEAIKAKTGVQVVAPRSVGSSQGSMMYASGSPLSSQEMADRLEQVRQEIAASQDDDPTAAYKARLAQIKAMGIGRQGNSSGDVSAPPMLLNTAGSSGSGNGYAQFNNNTGGDRWQLNSTVNAPRTPFELRAGFVVPATLISGINSELPGQIMAQVSQNVYDSATGKYLLIPQGSRLVGSYSSDVAYGQARVLVAWQRIVFPDGKALDIGSMPGADGAGYSGFHDQVNNHYFRTFASALLMSGITAGVSYSQDKNNNITSIYQNPTMSSEMSRALGQQLGQVAAQLITRNLNIAPTLNIRPGYRFNVIVTKDLVFSKPYREFDY